MERIIAPVDFSANAANAAEFAGNLAAFYGAELWLYHAYELPFSISSVNRDRMDVLVMRELEQFKKEMQLKLRVPININLIAEVGGLNDGINSFCEKIKPDLVVMGLTGKTGIAKLLAGSNTMKAVQFLKYSLLVVPPEAKFIPVQRIGFVCDYQKVLQKAPLGILEKIVSGFNAELYVVDVHRHSKLYNSGEVAGGIMLSEILRKFKPHYHTIESDDVATKAINIFVDKARLDMIVAVPNKLDLTEKIFKHSQIEDILYHAHVPVLCMHECTVPELTAELEDPKPLINLSEGYALAISE